MRGRNALLLLLVLAALTAYVLRFERGKPTEEDQALLSTELFRITPEFVNQIAIVAGADSLFLRRADDGQWMMVRPVSDRADNDRVRAFLSLFAPLRASERVQGSGGQQIKYRLDRPIAVATFTQPKGHGYVTSTLRVGRKNPAFDAYYCQADGDTTRIGLIDAGLIERYLLRGMNEFRQRHLLAFRSEDVARATIHSDGPPIVLERDQRRAWTIVSPQWVWPRQSTVNLLIKRFRELRKDAFVDDHPTALDVYGLDPAALTLTVVLDDQTTRSVRLGARDPETGGWYANRERDPRVFLISEASHAELNTSLDALRAPTLFEVAADRVRGLRIEAGDATLAATRDDRGGWSTASGTPLDAAPLDEVMHACRALRVIRYDDGEGAAGRAGLDRPDVRVVLELVDADPMQIVFRAGDPAFARVLPMARVAGQSRPAGTVAVVDGDVVERLRHLAANPPEGT